MGINSVERKEARHRGRMRFLSLVATVYVVLFGFVVLAGGVAAVYVAQHADAEPTIEYAPLTYR